MLLSLVVVMNMPEGDAAAMLHSQPAVDTYSTYGKRFVTVTTNV